MTVSHIIIEQEIRDELSKFAKACDDNGTLIPIAAREAMRSISHTLAWVLDQSVTIPPYNVHCGCCCFSETVKHTGSERDCALGPYMCLAVGWSDRLSDDHVGRKRKGTEAIMTPVPDRTQRWISPPDEVSHKQYQKRKAKSCQ